MASFAENVFEVFAKLRQAHRFVPATVVGGNRFASLVRSETNEVFVYLFVHDGRPGNVNVDVSLWVAPPHEPGDGLDNLYVGYKVRVGSEFNLNDQFFLNCQERVIHFLPCVAAMAPLVRTELQSPAFRTRRWICYSLERRVFSLLLKVSAEGNGFAKSAIEVARRGARGQATRDEIEAACTRAAASLIEGHALPEDVLRHYEGQPKRIGSGLIGILYAYALGEISQSLTSP